MTDQDKKIRKAWAKYDKGDPLTTPELHLLMEESEKGLQFLKNRKRDQSALFCARLDREQLESYLRARGEKPEPTPDNSVLQAALEELMYATHSVLKAHNRASHLSAKGALIRAYKALGFTRESLLKDDAGIGFNEDDLKKHFDK